MWLWDAKTKIRRIREYLYTNERILDIGSGPGSVSPLLSMRGFDVTPVDKKDLSFTHQIKPIIYDSNHIPFGNKQFGTSLLLTVLHHVYDPVRLLKEAIRISKKIIVIEDVYNNSV